MNEPPPPPAPLPLGAARALAGRLLGRLERVEAALRLAVTGGLRRMDPRVDPVELLATAHDAAPLLAAFVGAPRVAAVLHASAQEARVRFEDGSQATLTVLPSEEDVAVAQVQRTGPPAHVAELERRARDRGLSWAGTRLLDPQGLPLPLAEEADLYAALGLPCPPPERRGRAPRAGEPVPPVGMAEIQGVAGLYVRGGGGRYGVPELAARAAREGYAWALLLAEEVGGEGLEAFAGALGAWNDQGQPPRLLGAAVLPIDASGALLDPRPAGLPLLGVARLAAVGPAAVGPASAGERLTAAARDPRVDLLSLAPPPGTPHGLSLPPEALLPALAAGGPCLLVPPPPLHALPEPGLLEALGAAGLPALLSAEARDLVGVDDLILTVGLARRAGLPAALVRNALAPERAARALARGPRGAAP